MPGSEGQQQAAAYGVTNQPNAAILSPHEMSADARSLIRKYLESVAQLRLSNGAPLVSLILFGSAAKRAFTVAVSDVDLIIVLPDSASQADRREIQEKVFALEIRHGFRVPSNRPRGWFEKYLERCAGYSLSGFVCTRSDLLSGEVTRVLGLSPFEAVFVDRIVFAGVIVSAVTVWGEELLEQVPIPALRRLDVLKALFNFLSAMIITAAVFPVFRNATRYAMGVLKHSLHSCYFCYHQRTASVQEEVAFLSSRVSQRKVFDDLLSLRKRYTPSFAFVVSSLPVLFQLHLRTTQDNQFPQPVSRNTVLRKSTSVESELREE
jgi:predicted nucleotidyltransferase